MTEAIIASYGSWKSPITADLLVSETIGLGGVTLDGEDVYWVEMRPSEGGRNVVVKRTPAGFCSDVTLPGFNVRTRVHEYGGSSHTIDTGTLYFSNFADQRLYRQTPNNPPEPLTSLGNVPGDLRYADIIIDRHHNRLICVREEHLPDSHEPANTLVSINLETGASQILVSGDDFYAFPRLSPDGSKLCWISWNHPNLPWDGTTLWVAEVQADGTLGTPQNVAGGIEEAIFQPAWSPDNQLYFVSDRTGWWNLYRWNAGTVEPLYPMEAEFGRPLWVFGMQTYTFISAKKILCTYTQNGIWHLATLDLVTQQLNQIPIPYTEINSLEVKDNQAFLLVSSATEPTAIVQLDLSSFEISTLRRSTPLNLDTGYLSEPQTIEFPTENGQTAYAFFYPPKNKDYQGPADDKPPLLVKSHGGPTAAASSSLSLKIQYWTSRGFAYVDVNYGGSTGFGRDYRRRLDGLWGVVDVDDCANVARYLAQEGLVDGSRLAISGGSAGGYTTLCALTFRDTFKAGASYYGVSDLEALVRDTHKFEARYLDRLIGPYPEQKELYQQRSPIHATEQLACPVIFFQGLEDKVVPPNQAEMMVEALKTKGLPVAYVPFEGEQHGFRRAENIKRAVDAEFYFYAQVFGFEIAENIEPVPIDNLSPKISS
jgi:dipeptidyl aminopeptidase/acylaminoacyl peptidase